ncbi:MAG TPA: autotransporter domain-containing protein [Mesorhizobium sp.]
MWQEFLDATSTTSFSSAAGFIPFTADLNETWLEVGLGGSLQMTATTTLYGNANVETPFDGGDYGVDGKVGLRVNW